MAKIRRALIAVSDKSGVVELAQDLTRWDIEILSTGGTGRTLRDGGIPVRDVQDVTEFPEMMGGRVKTLHPRIHGGILGRRDVEGDLNSMSEHGIPPLDLVVVNLYPFERRVKEGITPEQAIEEIDIGGPAMIRAAAKNHAHVAVVVDPSQYPRLREELESGDGALSSETRRRLAMEAFRRTAAYDAAISNWFGHELEGRWPEVWTEQWTKAGDLRYGENPHQSAAWYSRADARSFGLPATRRRGDKALSYNNLLDATAAIECAAGLEGCAAVIVKHCLPCGAAERDDLVEAFEAARAGDPLSAFGGILALTRPLDPDLARKIATPENFFEVIHVPELLPGSEDAIRTGAKWGKNCRLLEAGEKTPDLEDGAFDELRTIPGAILVQEADVPRATRDDFRVVSRRAPTEDEWRDLLFAWRVVPHVRSNAILLAADRSVVGAGGGQPSRVDAVDIACRKAGERARGAVLASDAFFPFPDGVERAAQSGITAAIQPGGSRRDDEVIAAADGLGLALVLTGERHFRH